MKQNVVILDYTDGSEALEKLKALLKKNSLSAAFQISPDTLTASTLLQSYADTSDPIFVLGLNKFNTKIRNAITRFKDHPIILLLPDSFLDDKKNEEFLASLLETNVADIAPLEKENVSASEIAHTLKVRINALQRRLSWNRLENASSSEQNGGPITIGDLTVNRTEKFVILGDQIINFRNHHSGIELLYLLLSSKGHVFSRLDIADKIGKRWAIYDERSVDSCIKLIRKTLSKAGVQMKDNESGYIDNCPIISVIGYGYKASDDPKMWTVQPSIHPANNHISFKETRPLSFEL